MSSSERAARLEKAWADPDRRHFPEKISLEVCRAVLAFLESAGKPRSFRQVARALKENEVFVFDCLNWMTNSARCIYEWQIGCMFSVRSRFANEE